MIITTAEAIEIGSIPAAKSSTVTTLIPIIQDTILSHCRNHFINWDVFLASGDYEFDGDNLTISETSGQDATFTTEYFPTDGPFDVAIRGSYLNDDQVWEVTSRTATVLTLSSGQDLLTEDTDRSVTVFLVQFPKAVKMIAAMMASWAVREYAMSGVEQFSLADWSVTLASGDAGPGGWPVGLLKQLNRWRTTRRL
jgi:hypothetical protein